MLSVGKTILSNNVTWVISKEEFWHLVPVETDLQEIINEKIPHYLCMTLNNVYLKGGLFHLPTILKEKNTFQKNRSKNEEIFEEIRAIEFPDKPCRYRCVYLFKNKDDAIEKNLKWFQNRRKILKCHIVLVDAPLRIFEGDLNYVDMINDEISAEDVAAIARKYWNGELTNNYCLEVLVDGVLYFPEWENFSEYDLRPKIKELQKI